MIDPIGTFMNIRDRYISYIETAFGTRFEEFNNERRNLLHQAGVLYQQPWVEPIPDYKSSTSYIINSDKSKELSSEDLSGYLADGELQVFKDFVKKGLFPGDFPLYQHQLQMLQKATSGQNCVITSGTGSGKTESFLLPLFAYLIKDLARYRGIKEAVNIVGPQTKKDDGKFRFGPKAGIEITIVANRYTSQLKSDVLQRNNPVKTPAMRAMIIYPMNALVEDQLTRLRLALDSDEVREYCKDALNGQRIYFGRYNSESPVAGRLHVEKEKDGVSSFPPNNYKWNELRSQLSEIEIQFNAVVSSVNARVQKLQEDIDNEKDETKKGQLINDLEEFKKSIPEKYAKYQRLDGAEMRSRFDIQQTPPDILITNFSMLSIMMMRDVDEPIFQKTRDWLECKDMPEAEREKEKKNRIFHVIIDELHLYRGTAGTENAYLIRFLLHKLGLNANSEQVKFLASSASLEGEEGTQAYKDSQSFLKGFFGLDEDMEVISGEVKSVASAGENLDENAFQAFKRLGELAEQLKGQEPSEGDFNILKDCANQLTGDDPSKDGFEHLLMSMNSSQMQGLLSEIFKIKEESDNNPRSRAIPAHASSETEHDLFLSVSKSLFIHLNKDDKEREIAVRGLFYARGLFDSSLNKVKYKIKTELPRFRFHLFIRNIEGVWCTLKEDPDGNISKAENESPFNDLLPRLSINENGKKVFDALYCENCGTGFIGGNFLEASLDQRNSGQIGELISNDTDLQKAPNESTESQVDFRSCEEYGVFWPKEQITDDETIQDLVNWKKAHISITTGQLNDGNGARREKDVTGFFYHPDERSDKSKSAMPFTCPHCASDYTQRKTRKSPIRGFRSGFAKTNQILGKSLFTNLTNSKSKPRKLVSFSDSREDAAVFASDIEHEHYQELLRQFIVNKKHDLEKLSKLINFYEQGDSNNFKSLAKEVGSPADLIREKIRIVNDEYVDDQEKADAKEYLELVKEKVYEVDRLADSLLNDLIRLYMNPAGPSASLQEMDGHNWKDFFNWDSFTYTGYPGITNDRKKECLDDFKAPLYKGINSFLFGRLYFGMEAAGIGYATLRTKIKTPVGFENFPFADAVNSFIRLLGTNYRVLPSDFEFELRGWDTYNDEEPIPTGYRGNSGNRPPKNKIRRFVRALSQKHDIEEQTIGDALIQAIWQDHNHCLLKLKNLAIKYVEKDHKIHKCQNCGQTHLHSSAGICVFCFSDGLEEEESTNQNFLIDGILDNNEKPFRFRSEELTGQTDNQLERQRYFNEEINENHPELYSIDLLSVTTTLEVGIDIGSLQAVYQGNMPPQRFNYQQRVGRAGRAGQAFSMALTFCRGRSHDEYYFRNLHRITGDLSPVPFLSQDQKEILYRMLSKALLRSFFSQHPTWTTNDPTSGVHGEFGIVLDFINAGAIDTLRNWIKIDDNIKPTWKSLTNSLYKNGELVQQDYEQFKNEFLSKTFLDQIGKTIENPKSDDLAEALAEDGLLPMTGMPTRQRELITGFRAIGAGNNIEYKAKTISRSLDMAIFEFAPGAQKSKDKSIFTSIGLSSPFSGIRKNHANDGQYEFDSFGQPISAKEWVFINENNNIIRTKDWEETDIKEDIKEPGEDAFLVVTPNAFRTDWDSKPQDREVDQIVRTSKAPVFSEMIDEDAEETHKNAIVGLSVQNRTWKINHNNKEEYAFLKMDSYYYGDNYIEPKLDSSYLCVEFPALLGENWENAVRIDFFRQKNKDYKNGIRAGCTKYSLGASKTTNTFRISPAKLSGQLEINPFKNDMQGIAVKGAFYSAAFLLQRTLADNLDVSPEEIEVAAIIERKLEDGTDRSTGRIILADELSNGSGFVKHLADNLDFFLEMCTNPTDDPQHKFAKSFINEQHAKNCATASYEDLKNYRNLNYHGILDWRLAVSLIRIMKDDKYVVGLDGNFQDYIDISDWPEIANRLANSLKNILPSGNNYQLVFSRSGIPMIRFNVEQLDFGICIVHPFWAVGTHWPEENVLQEFIVDQDLNPENIFFIDTFNLERQLSMCYAAFIKWINNKFSEG
jgi:Lhr-like helicase